MTTGHRSEPTPHFLPVQPPRLLDPGAQAARPRGASRPTTTRLVSWVWTDVLFHGQQHPRALGLATVSRFLEHVVMIEKPPFPALESARAALELLYRPVRGIDLGERPRPQPPREALLARRDHANRAVRGDCLHTIPNPAQARGYRPGRKTRHPRQAR